MGSSNGVVKSNGVVLCNKRKKHLDGIKVIPYRFLSWRVRKELIFPLRYIMLFPGRSPRKGLFNPHGIAINFSNILPGMLNFTAFASMPFV